MKYITIISLFISLNVFTLPTWTALEIEVKPGKYQELQQGLDEFMKPPRSKFERNYQTYCGT